LKALEAQQEEDGGWPIFWEPPGEMARLEWRAHRTLKSLITFESYRKNGTDEFPDRLSSESLKASQNPKMKG